MKRRWFRAELDGYDDTDLIKAKYVRQIIDKFAKQESDIGGVDYEKLENCINDIKSMDFDETIIKIIGTILSKRNSECEDAVGRQASLSTIESMYQKCDGDLQTYHDLLVDCFEVLPPVQPKARMKGGA